MSVKDILKKVVAKTTPYIVCATVYEKMFFHRINSYKPLAFSINDYPFMKRERHYFTSSEGDVLTGYFYTHKDKEPHALIVFAHGYGGGGHITYLDLISYFVEQGFVIFAYDATANDESEGLAIKGFTQGYLDACKAIEFAKSEFKYEKLPLILMGHSWGAYSMSNALAKFNDAKVLVEFSGFNKSTAIFTANGTRYAGEKALQFVPNVEKFEELLFGKDASVDALDAFKNSKAKIIIVHSEDDHTVPTSCGIDLYEKHFKDNPRFHFFRLKDRGHGTVYYSKDGRKYYDDFHHLFNDFVKKANPNEELKEAFINQYLNRIVYNDLLDHHLLDQIIDIINS